MRTWTIRKPIEVGRTRRSSPPAARIVQTPDLGDTGSTSQIGRRRRTAHRWRAPIPAETPIPFLHLRSRPADRHPTRLHKVWCPPTASWDDPRPDTRATSHPATSGVTNRNRGPTPALARCQHGAAQLDTDDRVGSFLTGYSVVLAHANPALPARIDHAIGESPCTLGR